MPRQLKALCVVWASDLHVGSTVAIQPPVVELADGGTIHPSRVQAWLYARWTDLVERVRDEATRNRVVLILGGDMTDGPIHHGSLQTWGGQEDQVGAAVELLAPLARLAWKPANEQAHVYAIKGTNSHVGPMGDSDRAVAKQLNARWCEYDKCLQVGGRFIHCKHAASTSRRPMLRGDALRRMLRDTEVYALRQGRHPPDVLARGHVHIAQTEAIDGAFGKMYAFTSGAWKLADDYGHAMPLTLNDVGATFYYPADHYVEQVRYTLPEEHATVID